MAHFFCPKKYVPGQYNSICVQTDPVSKKAVAGNAVSGTEPQDFRQYPVDDLGIALGFFREIFVFCHHDRRHSLSLSISGAQFGIFAYPVATFRDRRLCQHQPV